MAGGGGGGGGGGGWPDLPLDLFSLIFSKLSLPQLLRSAAVCVSWSTAVDDLSTRSRRFKFQGQSPWLMFGGGPDGDPSAATFYNLDERREYTIHLPRPPISRRLLIGSAHGWGITVDTCSGLLQLLNPITGAQIDLPSVISSNHLNLMDNNNERSSIRTRQFLAVTKPLLGYLHLKATLSADPSLGDDYTVALIHYHLPGISFACSGHGKWLWLTDSILIQDMLFHKGKLYVATITGSVQICVFDDARLRRGEIPRFTWIFPSDHHFHFPYLAETPRGDLLSVRREKDRLGATVFVKVYRLVEEPRPRLEELKDLGGFIFFLGSNHPICLSACDFPHLTPNSIYFTDDDLRFFCRRRRNIDEQRWPGESQSCSFSVDVGIYSMTDHTFTRILPGDLRLNWPPPVWFGLD